MKKLNEFVHATSDTIFGTGRDPWVYIFAEDTGELYVAKKSSLSGEPGSQDYKWIRLKTAVSEEDYNKAVGIVNQLKSTQDKSKKKEDNKKEDNKKEDNKKEETPVQTSNDASLAKDFAIQKECMDNLWIMTSTPEGQKKMFGKFKSNPLDDDEAGAVKLIKTTIMPVIIKQLQKIKNTNNFEISTNTTTIKGILQKFYKTVKNDGQFIQQYSLTNPVTKKKINKTTNQTEEYIITRKWSFKWQYFNN
jgi:hypothetical protein